MEATLSVPPNSQAFDPANCSASLLQPGAHPQLQLSAPKAPVAVPTSDIGHLSTILTTLIRAGITQGHATSNPLVAPLSHPKQSKTKAFLKPSFPLHLIFHAFSAMPVSILECGVLWILSHLCTIRGLGPIYFHKYQILPL